MHPKTIMLVLLLCLSVFAAGQDKNGISWPGMNSAFAKEKMYLPFLSVDSSFRTAEGKTYNYLKSGLNTMVYFGMYGCLPCMAELPSIVEMARKHADMNFVYTTFNEDAEIKAEFDKILGQGYVLPANFHRVSMTQLFIALQNLTICYPVKYFLDKKGTVQYMQYQELKSFNGTTYDDYHAVNEAVIAAFNH